MSSRFGKKLVVIGIWSGIGVWIGMHFGGIGGTTVSQVPEWKVMSGAAQTDPKTVTMTNTPSGPAYVYIPVAIDPATGAYAPLPAQIQRDGSAVPITNLPEQRVDDYSMLSPGQILVPEEQKPTVDMLADKTAGLLQQASQKSIRWVVSLFDSAER